MKSDLPIGSVGGAKPLGSGLKASANTSGAWSVGRRSKKASLAASDGRYTVARAVIDAAVCFLCGSLQIAAAKLTPAGFPNPNIPLVAAAALGLWRGPEAGALVGLILGLLTDATWSKILGQNALALLYVGFFAGMTGRIKSMRRLPILIILCGALTVLYEGATFVAGYALPLYLDGYTPSVGAAYALAKIIAPALCANALLAIPMYFAFARRKSGEFGEDFT